MSDTPATPAEAPVAPVEAPKVEPKAKAPKLKPNEFLLESGAIYTAVGL